MSKILLIGAPGNISTSAIEDLFQKGHSIFALTTHTKNLDKFKGKVEFISGNRNDAQSLEKAKELAKPEIVVDFCCFNVEQAKISSQIFANCLKQYIFVSTVDVYGYPLSQIPMPENGKWNKPNCDYAANKVLCEEHFKSLGNEKLPLTIVRPAYSMGAGFLLTALSRDGGYSLIPRLLLGKELFSPDDGQALIHVSTGYNAGKMLACMVGDLRCIGEDFTIAHNEITKYDQYIGYVAELLGCSANFVHIPSDFVYSSNLENLDQVLLSDLTRYNVYFDIGKFKEFYPNFKWEKSLKETMQEFIDANKDNFADISKSSFEDEIIELYKNR